MAFDEAKQEIFVLLEEQVGERECHFGLPRRSDWCSCSGVRECRTSAMVRGFGHTLEASKYFIKNLHNPNQGQKAVSNGGSGVTKR